MTFGLGRRWLESASLVLGLLILGGTLWVIGLGGLARDLRRIGWGLGVVLLVETLNVLFNTAGWAMAFPARERAVPAWRLLALRLAGDGVNYLTPTATVGGELLRIRLLDGRVPSSVAWASVSAAKLGQTVAQAIFICLGLALVLPRFTGLPPWIGGVGAAAVVVLVGGGLVWLVGRGFWSTLGEIMRRFGVARFLPGAWADPGRDLDRALRRLGPARVIGILACFLGGWTVGAVEIAVILAWAGGAVDWRTALALETGSALVDGILFFVPAKVGTQEGGKVLLFATLGLDPARGLTVGVVRRIRELTYAGLGLAALSWLATRPPETRTSDRAEPALGTRGRQNV